jgi:hypothetical protein
MKRSRILALVTVATLAATGCAADPGGAQDTGASTDEALSGIVVPNPSDAYFARVTANGSGCPAGTWEASISPDGQELSIKFEQFEAILNPGQAVAVKDCTIGIDFGSSGGLSFAVERFRYEGYVMLDQPGMTARQTAKYYFTGNPLPARDSYSDMPGPEDNSYLFQDDILAEDLVWSPCGTSRRFNAQTRLVLMNNAAKTGSGYTNTTSVDADMGMVFRWNLSWRTC